MFVRIFSVVLVAVAYHANMLDYKECVGNDGEGGGVGIRWPQDDVRPIRAHRHVQNELPQPYESHTIRAARADERATGFITVSWNTVYSNSQCAK